MITFMQVRQKKCLLILMLLIQLNTGSDRSVSQDVLSAAEFHCILQQLIMHSTPFSNNMPPFHAFLSLMKHSATLPQIPRRWPSLVTVQTTYKHKHTVLNDEIQKKYVCTCASESVPNESFPVSSTSGQSSTQEETGSMCLNMCTCFHDYMTCAKRSRKTRFHPVVCLAQKTHSVLVPKSIIKVNIIYITIFP